MRTLRKNISRLLPAGRAKEEIKNLLYNLNAAPNTEFSLFGNLYSTRYNGLEFLTHDPLYHIVPDFAYYTHFYNIRPDDVIIDAGANRGYVALYLAMRAPNGKVIAFEPDCHNRDYISRNITLNPSAAEIEVSDLLLWNENTEICFCEAGTVGSSAHYRPEGVPLVKKQAVTIDSYVTTAGITKLDFIKMDIEGAEIEAMEGCLDTIRRFSPNFAIASYHIVNGEQTYIALEKFFDRIGYPYKTVQFKPTEIITFAGPSVVNA